MYMPMPENKFEIVDQSAIPEIPKNQITNPVYLYVISSDKGNEELISISSDTQFRSIYGDINYVKHGQPLLQAHDTVRAGGRVLVKRIVAEDSTLGNVIVSAKVSKVEEQKKDKDGKPLYTDAVTGNETTESVGNTPLMTSVCKIKYVGESLEQALTIDSVCTKADTLLDEVGKDGVFTYPLFAITDNGRGKCNKRFRISPQYDKSKHIEAMKYYFQVIENSEVKENIDFSTDSNRIESGVNKSLENVINTYSVQLNSKLFDTEFTKFLYKVADISGYEYEYCLSNDIFFGKTRKTENLENIIISDEEDALNLSYSFGVELPNGSNGSFGDVPFGSKDYIKQAVNFFNGEFTNEIYNLDKYKIDLIVDANYPLDVKKEIEKLTIFREDLFYIRDLGLNLKTEEDILAASKEASLSKYIGIYHNSYDIEDPYTKKQIPVTIGYSLSKKLVEHFKNGRTRPVAGQQYGFIFDEIIEGTVNYLPAITPKYNQKQVLCDNRINYISYFDNKPVLETLCTNQDVLTELSYINNILGIQEIVKTIRTKCPKNRYSFIEGTDLEEYQKEVQMELNKLSSNFSSLKMVYIKDETMIANKVYYAAIEVKFKPFVQSEYFKLYALANN